MGKPASSVEIRLERPEDVDAVGSLTTAAFEGAAHASGTEAAIVDSLREAGALTLSLVAVDSTATVGHVAFSPVAIGTEPGRWFALGPLSVRPDRQRCGIGGALLRNGFDRLQTFDASGCVVLGDPAYYGRFGFESDGALHYGSVPVRYLQRVVFVGASPVGIVDFNPAFDAR